MNEPIPVIAASPLRQRLIDDMTCVSSRTRRSATVFAMSGGLRLG